MSYGLNRDVALNIAGISKHKYYYIPKPNKKGRKCTTMTKKHENGNIVEVSNDVVVDKIREFKNKPDTDYGYIKTTYYLLQLGFIINRKKIYALMEKQHLLKDRHKKANRTFAAYRKVMPERPLEVIEMDIKYVWIEENKQHAYILTIIDTFTRVVLYWTDAYSIKKAQIKQAWNYIIENYLQPYDCLNRKMYVEIRNDNDSRFAAKEIQEFFKENYLNQVFTHPYTPQENGHIESFHAILANRIRNMIFWKLADLEVFLTGFYYNYNNIRIHSSIAYLAPLAFWELWNRNKIEMKRDEKRRKITFKLLIPYHEIKQHTGNDEPESCSLHDFFDPLQAVEKKSPSVAKEMCGAETSHNSRFKESPSSVPCIANI